MALVDVDARKFSDLPEVETPADDDELYIHDNDRVRKISYANLKKEAINAIHNSTTDISSLESRMSTAENNVSNLQTRTSDAESDIDTLQSTTKIISGNFSALTERVAGVEDTNNENRSNISTNANNISVNTANIAQNAEDIDTLESGLSETNTNVKNLTARVSTAESNITQNTNSIQTNADNIEAVNERIDNLPVAIYPQGTIAFADLPEAGDKVGDMYNISDDFTTTSAFAEGEGVSYPAGSNVYWTANEQWDVFAGVNVIGVKGNAETSYRNGNVNITPQNLGIDSAGDASTPVYFENGVPKAVTSVGVTVDGSIETATKLATARTFTVGNTGKTFDGSADVSWSLSEIGAVAKSGDTMTGNLSFANSGTTTRQVHFQVGDNDYGRVAAGATAANAGWMEIASADDGNEPVYARQYTGNFTTIKRTATLLDASGNTSFPGSVTASSFSGNASSATKLATARTISLTGGVTGSASFNGTANVSISTVSSLLVNMGTISSLPVTKTVSGCTANMVVAESTLGTPSAQISDWTITTAANKVTVSGSISGSTTLKLLLVTPTSVTAS